MNSGTMDDIVLVGKCHIRRQKICWVDAPSILVRELTIDAKHSPGAILNYCTMDILNYTMKG